MRLSRPRVLFRVALLTGLGGVLLWRAWGTRAAALDAGGDAALLRMAVVEAALGGVAILAAAMGLLALRKKARKHTLHLDDVPPPPKP
ncbi:MAG: hypothetical protein QM767_00540 [Anaeromyxobacter sp.]